MLTTGLALQDGIYLRPVMGHFMQMVKTGSAVQGGIPGMNEVVKVQFQFCIFRPVEKPDRASLSPNVPFIWGTAAAVDDVVLSGKMGMKEGTGLKQHGTTAYMDACVSNAGFISADEFRENG